MGDWGEDKRHGIGSLAILDAQEIRKEERRRIEMIMSIYFTWFPIGGYRRTQYITLIGLFYKNRGFYLEGCLTVKN